MNRRTFLRILGGGTILAAGGAGFFAATRVPARAHAPWSDAGAPRYADPRLAALSYAILAPNPHNRQPWLVGLDGDTSVTLWFDTDRQLPFTDPFDRQLTIGLGCFLALMEMAANAHGHRVETALFPEGEDPEGLDARPVAQIRFFPDSTVPVDPLWAQVPHRRSLKEPFDATRMVEHETLRSVLEAGPYVNQIDGSVEPDDVACWRQLTEDALEIEIDTPRTYQESVDLFRIGKAEVNANPDGIDFSGATFDILAATGLFTRESARDTTTFTYQQGRAAVLENARTAMGHLWMVSRGNGRADQIAAGADWLRANLAANAAGLGFHPLSQALQEYPEMSALYQTVHDRLAPDGGTVQMLARIGYGPRVAVSPRWPLEAKLVGQ
ncbi:MAG: twin-arginine translocation pathway signal protein [Pseudomonadota bacterium]